MFRISFPMSGHMVKPHFCTSLELATAIEAELFERFGDAGGIEDHPNPPHFDPGGYMFMNKPTLELGFVTVNSQHVTQLKDQLFELITAGPRKVGNMEYYKLHCPHTCIVLTPSEANVVLSLLTV